MNDQIVDSVLVENIPVHLLTKSALVQEVLRQASEKSRLIRYLNTHALNLAHDNGKFGDSLRRADIVFCDGVGVVMAARLLGQPGPKRLSVMDWLDDALGEISVRNKSVYFLGATSEEIDAATTRARERHPTLEIAGCNSGYFDRGNQEEAIIADLNRTNPDIVFVGMGMPRQEFWVDHRLNVLPKATYVSVGAAFSWYSGEMKRPNTIYRRLGLEWLGRLALEPRRLWRRYLVGNPRFVWRILLTRLRR